MVKINKKTFYVFQKVNFGSQSIFENDHSIRLLYNLWNRASEIMIENKKHSSKQNTMF